MSEHTLTAKQVMDDFCSRDPGRVRSAAHEILARSQDPEYLRPLTRHMLKLKLRTRGLELGGLLAPNQRFVDFALQVLEFHKKGVGCPCALYPMSGDSIYSFPMEVKRGNLTVLDTVLSDDGPYVDHYLAECPRCGQKYEVIEREYHYTWWRWTAVQ